MGNHQVFGLISASSFSTTQTTFDCANVAGFQVGGITQLLVAAKDTNGAAYTADDISLKAKFKLLSSSANNRNYADTANAQAGVEYQLFHLDSNNWAASLTTVVSGTYELTLWSGETQVGPTCSSIQVSTGAYSKYFATPADLVGAAGKPVSLELTLLDVYDNALPVDVNDVLLTLAYNPSTVQIGVTIPPFEQSITALDTERVSIQFTNTVTGDVNLTIKVQGNTIVSDVLTIYAGDQAVSSSTAVLSFFNSPKPVSSVEGQIVISAKDLYGNAILPVPLEPTHFYLFLNQTTATSASQGSYNYTGVSYAFKAEAGKDNLASKYVALFSNVTVAGFYKVSVVKDGQNIQGSPLPQLFQVLPDEIDASQSELMPLDLEFPYKVGVEYSFLIVGRDIYGNQRLDNSALEFIDLNLITEKTEKVNNSTISYKGNGSFGGTFKFTASGKHSLFATIFDASVKNSPVSLTAYADTSAEHSKLVGDGVSFCKQGETCKFVVLAYDQYDNLQTGNAADDVQVTFSDPTTKLSSITQISKGQYSVTYVGGTLGSVKMTVSINGQTHDNIQSTITTSLNNTSIGLTAGAGFFALVLGGSGYYLAKKQQEIKKMRQEWENMRSAVYREYQMRPEEKQDLADVLKNGGYVEDEWSDHEGDGSPKRESALVDGKEWEQMENWFERKNVK